MSNQEALRHVPNEMVSSIAELNRTSGLIEVFQHLHREANLINTDQTPESKSLRDNLIRIYGNVLSEHNTWFDKFEKNDVPLFFISTTELQVLTLSAKRLQEGELLDECRLLTGTVTPLNKMFENSSLSPNINIHRLDGKYPYNPLKLSLDCINCTEDILSEVLNYLNKP